jgi:hypothetical protein
MSVTTKTIWGPEFTQEKSDQWDLLKRDFLNKAVDAGKVSKEGTKIAGVEFGGERVWADKATADLWIQLVEAGARELNATVDVSIKK